LHLRVQLPRRVFLLGRQVAKGVHAIQHLLTLLRRQAVETIKLILQMLLLLRRKTAELGVALQRLSLLFRRQIVMLAQPLSGMSILLRSRGTGHRVRGGVLLSRTASLRQGRNSARERQRKSRYRDPSGYELHPHFSPVFLDDYMSQSPSTSRLRMSFRILLRL
jgi:hypothetical protein